ncbi:hypothetical protein PLICRDRAFT_171593 [Plicaturopsis crispa FD-325 SS-3]|nr:hypothetical protein PLICRDRAFT_171593 [Plicaturopsis crispa FD-325 SS-3]
MLQAAASRAWIRRCDPSVSPYTTGASSTARTPLPTDVKPVSPLPKPKRTRKKRLFRQSDVTPTLRFRNLVPLADGDMLPHEELRWWRVLGHDHRHPRYIDTSHEPAVLSSSPPVTSLPNADVLPDVETQWWRDAGRNFDAPGPTDAPPQTDNIFVNTGPLETLQTPHFPQPSTRAQLRDNIRYSLSHHMPSPPSLPGLVAYQAEPLHPPDSPQGSSSPSILIQSTQSYNDLIDIALRHEALGTAKTLFASMREAGVKGNLTTWKLSVRWMVRSDRWYEAWSSVMEILGYGKGGLDDRSLTYGAGKPHRGMPLPVWLEFFGTTSRSFRAPKKREVEVSNVGYEVAQKPKTQADRYRMLLAYPPALTPGEVASSPPRAVLLTVKMLLRTGQASPARALAVSYISQPPPTSPRFRRTWERTCLSLIHMHIAYPPRTTAKHGPQKPKRGLQAHFRIRKYVYAFFDVQPALVPTSTTLYLLLGTLAHARPCGKTAAALLHSFRKRWGARVEDQRVRRRVAALAVKDRRWDIARGMFAAENRAVWQRRQWAVQRELLGGEVGVSGGGAGPRRPGWSRRRFLREPWRTVYKRKGAEGRKWFALRRRVRRMHGRR